MSIIGVGAVGRQLAIQLASLGVQYLTLIDFDKVERTNITTQGYRKIHLGYKKVDSVFGDVMNIDKTIKVTKVFDRWRPHSLTGNIVFCCVDSIKARTFIWKGEKKKKDVVFFCDARMLGETIHIHTVDHAHDDGAAEFYEGTLFEEEDTIEGSCTAQGTIYTAAIAAGLMVSQFTRWLRAFPVERWLNLTLLADQLNVITELPEQPEQSANPDTTEDTVARRSQDVQVANSTDPIISSVGASRTFEMDVRTIDQDPDDDSEPDDEDFEDDDDFEPESEF